MDAAREKARRRKRRIIYNNDGNDVVRVTAKGEVTEGLMEADSGDLKADFLDTRTAPLVGTQVDSNWYATCMCGQIFSHHTKLGGFRNDGLPLKLVEKYGHDNLDIQTDFVHGHGMEAFWSLRMNDVHDSHPPGDRRWSDYGLAPFKRDHPEFLFGKVEDWYGEDASRKVWSGMDFSIPQVRDHVVAHIEEVARNYDVDGLEMDFLRTYPYFLPTREMKPVAEEQLEMMTDLVRRVRTIADDVGAQRGRPLLLAARTPFSVDDARFVGLDLESWVQEELLDLLVPGGGAESHMTETFADIITLGHDHGISVYPCIGWGFSKDWAFLDLAAGQLRTFNDWIEALRAEKTYFGDGINSWHGTMGAWRGAATNLFDAGADGIYTFNGFFAGPEIWDEIGDPVTMAGKDKVFGVDRFGGESSINGIGDHAEPILAPGEAVETHFQVGEDSGIGSICELRLRIYLWEQGPADELQVKLNGFELAGLKAAGSPHESNGGGWLQARLEPSQVKQGRNEVALALQRRDPGATKPLSLGNVQLQVRY